MFAESSGFDKNFLLISHASDGHQSTEYAWSQSSSGCEVQSTSSDRQNQLAVVQALMDLDASARISYPGADASSKQNLAFDVPQKNFVKPAHPDPVQNIESGHFSRFCKRFFAACITSEVIEVACSCMLSQLFLADHRKMSDTDQEYVVLAEFAKCLGHILDSVNKLRNARFSVGNYGKDVLALSSSINLPVAEKDVACVYPTYPLTSVSYTLASEFSTSLPYPAGDTPGETCGSATFQGIVSTDQAYVEYSDFPVSSEMSKVSLPQCDPNYSAFKMVLSPGAGDASKVVEVSNLAETIKVGSNGQTVLIPCGMLSPSLSEIHSYLLPSSSPPQQLPAYPLNRQTFFMSSSTGTVSSEDATCYPLTYSTEADLAAAAISTEVDPTLAADRPDDCDYGDNVDENGGDDCVGVAEESFHPNALDLACYSFSTPFDLIPTEF
ncbi:conserved hypothetical protein [Echinococcus multilocularis]|uniref:Uncharacterized protein n=1 Tax=Echinococcus multilocularis TaxID=6211 RepID=A0A068Y361_ECHMU|nr:conserved hypothetical protein [Echinococcus multilocularis]